MAMIEAEAASVAAKYGTKIILALVGFVVTAGIGATAAEVYEHKVPWGLSAQLDRSEKSIPPLLDAARRTGASDQAALDKPAFDAWSARVDQCEAKATRTSQDDAALLAAAQKNSSSSRDAAFNLGRATCNATPPPAGSPAAAGVMPVGDTDLRTILGAAAYAPTP